MNKKDIEDIRRMLEINRPDEKGIHQNQYDAYAKFFLDLVGMVYYGNHPERCQPTEH